MTKKGYLRQLKWHIGFSLPRETARQTLARYEAYFADGIQAGKSEAQLADECGPPSLVAAELLSAEHSLGVRFAGGRLLLTAVLWVLLSLWYRGSVRYFGAFPWALLILLGGLAATFFLMGGIRLSIKKTALRGRLLLYAISLLLPTGLGVFLQFGFVPDVMHSLSMGTYHPVGWLALLNINEMAQVGRWMEGLLQVTGLVAFLLLLLSAYAALRGGCDYLPPLCTNAGFLMAATIYREMLKMLTDVESLSYMTNWVYASVGVGLGAALLIFLAVLAVRRFPWKRS